MSAFILSDRITQGDWADKLRKYYDE